MNLDNVLGGVRAAARPRHHPPPHGDLDRRLDPGHRPRSPSRDMPIRLALSLHAADDALRSQIMPVNDRYPLADVLAACERFYEAKRRMVFVEYVMLAGVNDRYEQALALAELLDPRDLQGQPDPVQPDRARLRRLLARGDRRVPGASLEEHGVPRDGAAHARPRHRRRLRPAGREGRRGLGDGARAAGRPAPAPPARASPALSSRSRSSASSSGDGSHARRRAGRPATPGRRASGTAASCGTARRRTASGRPPRSGRARAAWRPRSRR